jgi:hypothetical protein
MKRITRERRLTPEEAAKYQSIREQVADELPELVAQQHTHARAISTSPKWSGRFLP